MRGRFAPELDNIQVFEGTVKFLDEVKKALLSEGKLKSSHFERWWSSYGYSDVGLTMTPMPAASGNTFRGQAQLDYFDSLMRRCHQWQLGEAEKPKIEWDDFQINWHLLAQVKIELGIKR